MLFDILSKYDLKEVYISDINAELINTYRIIRDHIDELVAMLMVMQSEFVPMDTEHRKIYYMAKRERFNDLKINGNEDVNIEKAAPMIFLLIRPALTACSGSTKRDYLMSLWGLIKPNDL